MAIPPLPKLRLILPATLLLWAAAVQAQSAPPASPAPAAPADARLIAKVVPTIGTNILRAPSPQAAATDHPDKLTEKELLLLLTSKLQPNTGTDELELKLARKWEPLPVPPGSVDLRILEKPPTGLAPQFVVRFELLSGEKSLGAFVAFLQAHLYRNVWVARSPLKRATALDTADLEEERRDVINLREATWSRETQVAPFQLSDYQITQSVPAGQIVLDRYAQLRPVMKRGDHVQAVIKDEFMMVSATVEVLADGAPGEFVRARNLRTKKELYGKVINRDTIQIK